MFRCRVLDDEIFRLCAGATTSVNRTPEAAFRCLFRRDGNPRRRFGPSDESLFTVASRPGQMFRSRGLTCDQCGSHVQRGSWSAKHSTDRLLKRVSSASSKSPSTLKGVLAELDIVALTPEWVAEYKQTKLLETTYQLRPREAEEIEEREFSSWEYAELDRLHDEAERQPFGDAPLIRFRRLCDGIRCYTYLR